VVLVFATALFYTYKLKIAPLYGYAGLTYREPELGHYAIAIALTIVVGIALPRRISRVSDFILWVLFTLAVAPSILLAQYSKTLPVNDATIMGVAVAAATIMVILLTAAMPSGGLPIRRLNSGADFWVLITIFSVSLYTYLVATTGLQLRTLSFSDVYDVRGDFATASTGDAIIGYLLPIQANVVNPLLMARGVYSGRVAPFAIGFMGQLVIYSSTGHKSVLFAAVALVGIAGLFRFSPRPRGLVIMGAVAAASTTALLVDRLLDTTLWTSLISRRLMVVPGALTAAYVLVFQHRPRQNFADVIPGIKNPYDAINPTHIVGAEFIGNSHTAANVNLFGHGYLNFGYLGMFIEAGVLVLLLALANAATRGMPTAVAALVFFSPALALVSGSVFTTTLTHGFFAAIVICAIAPNRGWGRRRRSRIPGHSLAAVRP
jgi:hypothetical protein